MKYKCVMCGKEIKNPYFLNGKTYGYSCYKKELSILYKKWEDEHNANYSSKCFAAIQIFKDKPNNSFHDSICEQWESCKKLTAKQLECIIKCFSLKEKISFWLIWFSLTTDEFTKKSISSWMEIELCRNQLFYKVLENEAVLNCLLYNQTYKNGFFFWHDVEDDIKTTIISKNEYLQDFMENEYTKVLKVVKK